MLLALNEGFDTVGTPLCILLADDSRFFRGIESQFLQKVPVKILEAEDCAAVLAVMKSDKPDLVFMAFSLPKEGGAACCQAIKSDPELSSIPVVIICDKDEPEQVKIAQHKGCDAYLVKPLDRYNFLQIGRKFLAGIREHRQRIFLPVTFTADGEEFSGKCLDISGGGTFIESKADVSIGTVINLSFKLPDSLSTQINCRAEVSWPNHKPNPLKPHYSHGFGARFLELSPGVYKAILRLSDKNPFG